MADNANPKAAADPGSNTIKDPDDWTTGDEPMTGAQRSMLLSAACAWVVLSVM